MTSIMDKCIEIEVMIRSADEKYKADERLFRDIYMFLQINQNNDEERLELTSKLIDRLDLL